MLSSPLKFSNRGRPAPFDRTAVLVDGEGDGSCRGGGCISNDDGGGQRRGRGKATADATMDGSSVGG